MLGLNNKSREKPAVLLSSTGNTITLQLDGTKTYTFDWAGRLVILTTQGRSFVRGLDGRIKEKSWPKGGDVFDRFIRNLTVEEIRTLYLQLYQDLQSAGERSRAEQNVDLRIFQSQPKEIPPTAEMILTRLLHWTPARLAAEEEAFRSVYHPVNILPPDQYLSIVLQVVEGCPWNKCSFCNFYAERPFRIRTVEEVMQHITCVKKFLGDSARLRRSVFLCDANAMVMSARNLLTILKEVQHQFPHQSGLDGGIYTFGDVPAILGKTQEDLSQFKKAGMRRVTIGMESGSDDIRHLIRKPRRQKDLISVVRALKEAQLEVGLIVLLGVGGVPLEEIHIQETVSAIKQMDLGRGDLVYFSPYYPSSEKVHYPPVTKEGIRNQYQAFLKGLGFSKEFLSPLTAVYDIREFVV